MGRMKNSAGKPSAFVVRCFEKLDRHGLRVAIDVPCGFGRHTHLAVREGYNVLAIDVDPDRLHYVRKKSSEFGTSDRITTIAADAKHLHSLELGAFSLAITSGRDFPTKPWRILHI
jgi:ubiquinone/menaquinone biosynthesis C-methylase UbiE